MTEPHARPFADDPRFESKVQVGQPDECWPWLGSLDRDGYGTYCLPRNGGTSTRVKAHRYGLGLASGEAVQRDLVTDHLCRNPPCCNPDHLEAVTQAENLARSPLQRKPGGDSPVGDFQRAKTSCAQGHPYDTENTGRTKDGHRYCRACARNRMRRKAAERKASA